MSGVNFETTELHSWTVHSSFLYRKRLCTRVELLHLKRCDSVGTNWVWLLVRDRAIKGQSAWRLRDTSRLGSLSTQSSSGAIMPSFWRRWIIRSSPLCGTWISLTCVPFIKAGIEFIGWAQSWRHYMSGKGSSVISFACAPNVVSSESFMFLVLRRTKYMSTFSQR